MRHAKSSWDDPQLADIDRPLNSRGRKAAARIAKHIKGSGAEPSMVLCSSAVRARQTLELLQPAFSDSIPVKIEHELYPAGSKDLMTRIRRLPATTHSVLVLGHNPAIQDLVLTLAAEDPRSGEIRRKFPTAALAVFNAAIEEWGQLDPNKTSLLEFITPKGLHD